MTLSKNNSKEYEEQIKLLNDEDQNYIAWAENCCSFPRLALFLERNSLIPTPYKNAPEAINAFLRDTSLRNPDFINMNDLMVFLKSGK
jgi:hypothetical protein